MILNNSDNQWESWGQKDPCRGVLTQEKFNINKLSSEALDDFFDSGVKHVEQVMKLIKEHLDQDFVPKRTAE
jgi:hypothetical protein